MIEVEVNGSIYSGRLVQITARDHVFDTPEGILLHKNYAYSVYIMDANGVEFSMDIKDLNQITFVG